MNGNKDVRISISFKEGMEIPTVVNDAHSGESTPRESEPEADQRADSDDDVDAEDGEEAGKTEEEQTADTAEKTEEEQTAADTAATVADEDEQESDAEETNTAEEEEETTTDETVVLYHLALNDNRDTITSVDELTTSLAATPTPAVRRAAARPVSLDDGESNDAETNTASYTTDAEGRISELNFTIGEFSIFALGKSVKSAPRKAPTANDDLIYFLLPSGTTWSTVYVYMWNGSTNNGWPGSNPQVTVTKVPDNEKGSYALSNGANINNYNIYYFARSAFTFKNTTAVNLIFNNGSGTQTGNLNVSDFSSNNGYIQDTSTFVTVTRVQQTGISISDKSIVVGGSSQLEVSNYTEEADSAISYSSSDENIATVSNDNGVVTVKGISTGSVTIMASVTVDGSEVTATCTLYVVSDDNFIYALVPSSWTGAFMHFWNGYYWVDKTGAEQRPYSGDASAEMIELDVSKYLSDGETIDTGKYKLFGINHGDYGSGIIVKDTAGWNHGQSEDINGMNSLSSSNKNGYLVTVPNSGKFTTSTILITKKAGISLSDDTVLKGETITLTPEHDDSIELSNIVYSITDDGQTINTDDSGTATGTHISLTKNSDGTATVRGIVKGSAKITAFVDSYTASCTVTVVDGKTRVYFNATLSKLDYSGLAGTYNYSDANGGMGDEISDVGIPSSTGSITYFAASADGSQTTSGDMKVLKSNLSANGVTYKEGDIYYVDLPSRDYTQIAFSNKALISLTDSNNNRYRTDTLTIPWDSYSNRCFYAGTTDNSGDMSSKNRTGYWAELYSVYNGLNTEGLSGNTVGSAITTGSMPTIDTNGTSSGYDQDITYLSSTLYDYYSDYELNGLDRSTYTAQYYSRPMAWVQFRQFDQALSDYYSGSSSSPLYTGIFQPELPTGDNKAIFANVADTLNLYGWSSNTNNYSFFAANIATVDNNGPMRIGSTENYYANKAAQGLVDSSLSGGSLTSGGTALPFFNESFLNGNNSKNAVIGKTYNNVQFPFRLRNNGSGVKYYTYDSSQTSVFLKQTDGGQYFLEDAGDAENSKNLTTSGDGTRDSMKGYFPFNANASSRDKPYNTYNYGFGTKIEFKFSVGDNGNVSKDATKYNNSGIDQPMIFQFSGDDDVWVFIDGKLVLDIGGDHDHVQGAINFSKPNNGTDSLSGSAAYPGLGEDYKLTDIAAGTAVVSDTKATGNNSSSGKSVQQLSELLGSAYDTFYDTGKTHTLTMYYMERGTWASNMMVSFNMTYASTTAEEKVWSVNDTRIDGSNTIKPGTGTWSDFASYGNNGDTLYYAITGSLPEDIASYREANEGNGTYNYFDFSIELADGITPTLTLGTTPDVQVWLAHATVSSNTVTQAAPVLDGNTVEAYNSDSSHINKFINMTNLYDVSYTAAATSGDPATYTPATITVSLKRPAGAGGKGLAGYFKTDNSNNLVSASEGENGEFALTGYDKIIVTYTGTLNESAEIGGAGNTNRITLTYSYYLASAEANAADDGQEGNVGTSTDENTVFTFKLRPTKYKDSVAAGNELAGAVFTIYDGSTVLGQGVSGSDGQITFYKTSTEKDEAGNFSVLTATAGEDGQVTYTVKKDAVELTLGAGTYTLHESKAPEGFNAVSDFSVTIAATGNLRMDHPTMWKTDGNGDNLVTAEVSTSANSAVSGFAFGSNVENSGSSAKPFVGMTVKPQTVIIENPTNSELTADESSGTITGNIVNTPGVELPSTGGSGTLPFRTVGALLSALSSLLLIMWVSGNSCKKKRWKEE